MEILDLFDYVVAKGMFEDKKRQGKMIVFAAIIFLSKDTEMMPSC